MRRLIILVGLLLSIHSTYSQTSYYLDMDGDGYGNILFNGSNNPNSYSLCEFYPDCDDSDATVWQMMSCLVDNDHDWFGDGSTPILLCVGYNPPLNYCPDYGTNNSDCNDNNPLFYEKRVFYIDLDGDGYDNGTDTICYGYDNLPVAPSGYSLTSFGPDCNDNAFWEWQTAYVYLDVDGDGYTNGQTTACYGYSLAPPYSWTSLGQDCNDFDMDSWVTGSLFIDLDQDGYDNGIDTICYGYLPQGYSSTTNGRDCNDNNSAIWQKTVFYIDSDSDGYDNGMDSVCSGATAPTGYSVTTLGMDCNDSDLSVWHSALLYIDIDNDGYCTDSVFSCYGANLPAGMSLNYLGFDCDDSNNSIWQSDSVYVDLDNDGLNAGKINLCYGVNLPQGYSFTTQGIDCNDNDSHLPPVALINANSATTFCSGDSVLLIANIDPALHYKWYLNGVLQSQDSNYFYIAKNSGQYTVEEFYSIGCEVVSNSIIVTVNPKPSAGITQQGILNFCQGDSLLLIANCPTCSTILWNNQSANDSIVVVSSGTRYYVGIDGNGCSSTSSIITVNVHNTPKPKIFANKKLVLCQGKTDSITLSAKAFIDSFSLSYHSLYTPCNYNNTVLSSSHEVKFVDPFSSYDIYINGGGSGIHSFCAGNYGFDPININLSVVPGTIPPRFYNLNSSFNLPDATTKFGDLGYKFSGVFYDSLPIFSTPTSPYNFYFSKYYQSCLCWNVEAASVNDYLFKYNIFKSTFDGSYYWSTGDTSTSISVSPTQTTTYYFYVNYGSCGVLVDSVTIKVEPNPSVSISATGPLKFCSGGSVSLYPVSNHPIMTYLWSDGSSDSVRYISTSSILSVSVVDTNGCQSQISNQDTVSVIPYVWSGFTINPQGSISSVTDNNVWPEISYTKFCSNIPIAVNLTASPYPNISGITYVWYLDTIQMQKDTSMYFSVSSIGNYTLQVYLDSLCPSNLSYSPILSVNTVPSTSSYISDTLCNGDSIMVANYFFSQSGQYTLNTNNYLGCDSVIYFNLSVLPTSSSSINVTICQGDSSFVNGIAYSVTGIYSQHLINFYGCDSLLLINLNVNQASSSILNQSICSGDSTFLVNSYYSQPGQYYAQLNNYLGCDSSIILNLSVLSSTSQIINDTICQGDSIVLNGVVYSALGVYNQHLINAMGCDSNITLNLTFYLAPSTQAIFGQTSITPFQSYVYAINQVAGINYTWTATNGVIQNGQGTNSVTVMWGNSGPYQLQLIQTSGGGCSDTTYLSVANSSCVINYNIQVIANTVYCAGDTVKLVAQTSTSGVNYQWTNNSQNIVGATNDTLIITQSGTYQLLMTFGSCAVLSSVYPITFNPKPSPPQIQSAGWNNLCATQQVTLSTTTTYNSYLWSNGQTSATINVNQSGNYSVIGFNAFGCGASSSITPISLSLAPSYNICMVTVDSATSSNKVVWEKPSKRGVDSFYILKESNVLNVYNNIGRVGVNDSSIYVDLNSVPQQHADRYEIAVKDSCGNISLPSAPHKTMHLTINQGLGGVWNLIWTPYEGMSFNTYDIYRANSAGQYQLIGSVSAANTSFTDINPPSFVLNYKVAITHPGGCSPSSKGSNQSYMQTSSNIVTVDNSNGLGELSGINLNVYPNPNDGYFNVSFTDKVYRKIELLNVLGQVIYSINTDETKVVINKAENSIAKGVYTLHVVQGDKQVNVRVVVE